MRVLLILLLIYVNYVLTDDGKFKVKVYPKKVKPGKIQIINSGKIKKAPTNYVKKRLSQNYDGYTVFPLVHKDNIPKMVNASIPYFVPQDSNVKTRVKKVLPDYVWSLRRKRSVAADDAPPKPIEKVPVDTPKVETAAVKTNPTGAATAKAKPKEKSAAAVNKSKKNKAKPKSPPRSGVGRKTKPNTKKGRAGKITKAKPQKRNGNKKNVRSKKNGKPRASKPARGGQAAKGKQQNKRKASRRLISGRDAVIEDYPYVVSIQKAHRHWCAGALLNPRLVVTTANCMWKSNRMSRMEVRAGSRHVDHGGQLAGISEVMKHPGWGIRKEPDYDIALVLLDRNLRFSDSIHGVDLPNRAMVPPFDDAWVTSWGSERRDGVYESQPGSLQVYHARIMDRGKCNNVTQRFGVTVTDNFICLSQNSKRAPCTRDTGAPAVSDGVLWGLASWGIRKLCGTERFPAMFSYLASSANMDFIMNATHYLMADERFYPFPDWPPLAKAKNTARTTED